MTKRLPTVNQFGSSQEVLVVVSGFRDEYSAYPFEVARVSLGTWHVRAGRWLTHLHHVGQPVVTHWAEKPDLPAVQMELF